MNDAGGAAAGTGRVMAGEHRQSVPAETQEILTAVGEVVYEWTIGDDAIRWGANVASVLGIASADKGLAFAAFLDTANLTSRHDAVLNGTASDQGEGVAYEVQYALLPDGAGGNRRLIVEDTGRWYADETGRPARACGVLRIINERHEREQRLAFLSRYDELTGYFNRQHLLTTLGEALDNAKKFRTSIAFMIVAVDSFRAINEAYGFETADQVFAVAARRIKSQLREGDAIGRYSGNKLGIVLINCDEDDMHAAAERFHAAIRDGVITAESSSVAITVSIGGVGLPRHGRTLNEALARAQESLHRARTRGYGRFVAYAPSPSRQARRRSNAALSSEMVAALESNRLRLFFQPVVDIVTREPTFHEGLLRLERADGTFAPATDFIELCEQLGLIRLIDNYTLARTVETLEAIPTARLSLNVSGETVGDAEWLSLSRNGGGAKGGSRQPADCRNHRDGGDPQPRGSVAFHRDTSRSRLSCCDRRFWRRLLVVSAFAHPCVDVVKIAGAFVENLPRSRDDQAFVKALTELARNFEIEIVAEWVQDEETVTMLAGFGVQMIQGLYSGMASPEASLIPVSARKAG